MKNHPVLYAEDDENDALLLQSAFDKVGVNEPLLVVPNGSAAIEYLQSSGQHPDRDQTSSPAS